MTTCRQHSLITHSTARHSMADHCVAHNTMADCVTAASLSQNKQHDTTEPECKCGDTWRLACHSWSSSGVRAMYLLMTAASKWPQCSGDSHCVRAVLASSRGLLSVMLSAQHSSTVVQPLCVATYSRAGAMDDSYQVAI